MTSTAAATSGAAKKAMYSMSQSPPLSASSLLAQVLGDAVDARAGIHHLPSRGVELVVDDHLEARERLRAGEKLALDEEGGCAARAERRLGEDYCPPSPGENFLNPSTVLLRIS